MPISQKPIFYQSIKHRKSLCCFRHIFVRDAKKTFSLKKFVMKFWKAAESFVCFVVSTRGV